MNYEKEYKEALERARKINSGEGVSAPPDWTICEVIFPELKENEDEKIRKAILNCFIKCWGNCKGEIYGIHAEDAIAWLEKQEEFDDNIITREDEILQALSIGLSDVTEKLGWNDFGGLPIEEIHTWLEKQGKTFTKKDVDDAYLKGICDAKQELEKQCEQKQILDFKASNWYVSKVDGKIHDMTYNPTDKKELKKLTQSVTKKSEQDKPIVLTDTEKKMFDNLISYINNRKGLLDEIKILYTDWLKSLKDRLKGE